MTGLVGVQSGRIDVWRLLLAVAMMSVLIDNCVAASPAETCAAKKYKAAGRKLYGKAKCHQKALLKPTFPTSDCLAKVEQKFSAAFVKVDASGGCVVQNNASEVEAAVDDCLASFTAAITGEAKCAAAKTKAVGRRAYDEMKCRQQALLKGQTVDAECLGKAEARFTAAIAKADGLGTCSDTATALEGLVGQCMTGLNPGCGEGADSFTCGGPCDPGWACAAVSTSPLQCGCVPAVPATTCEDSEAPTCGGTCNPGWACTGTPFFSCYCVPSCLTSEAPTCGGTCPDGQLCGDVSGFGCRCVGPEQTCLISQAPACGGDCPSGQVCGRASGQNYCTCVTPDDTCAISEAPTCGGTCPDGLLCGQLSGYNSCACVPPDATCTISEAPACGGTCDYLTSSYSCQSGGGSHCFCLCDSSAPCPFSTKWGGDYPGSADGQFNSPLGIAVEASGDVYVADTGNYRIQKFTSTGTFLTKWGNPGTGNGQFSPTDVAGDASGNVYVADLGNNRIQKFTNSGTFLTKWGSLGSADGQFFRPSAVAVDALGDVYVADSGNHRIQKFASDGSFLVKWGSYGSGDGQFNLPGDITVDASGNVFVADLGNVRIQKFTSTGAFLGQWGSAGGGDGQFAPGQFTPRIGIFYDGGPHGLAVDAVGNVYVADPKNARIQKFTNAGVFLTKWGCLGSADGSFQYPVGVSVAGSGEVLVVDAGGYYTGYLPRVQKFACP